MKLFVGLGNPGQAYEGTRHNFGFSVMKGFSEKHACPLKFKLKFNAEIGECVFDGEKVLLAMPQTFMNRSGEAISAIATFHKIPTNEIIVIFDDIDLQLGKMRILKNGGAGTHNGMKSIVSHIGKNFARIRMGIECRGVFSPKEQETASFVLEKFHGEERKIAMEMCEKGIQAMESIIGEGLDISMNKFNRLSIFA